MSEPDHASPDAPDRLLVRFTDGTGLYVMAHGMHTEGYIRARALAVAQVDEVASEGWFDVWEVEATEDSPRS